MSLEGKLLLSAASSRRVTAVELVAETLRSAILRGELAGGAKLVQTEIATQLDVSTTPVREAMRDLASEGLISLDSHRIGTVRTPDWDEMTEIVVIRRALEPSAIDLWMQNISSEDVDYARSIADELAGVEDTGTWVQRNNEFHAVFHRVTSTKWLGSILVALERASGVFVAQAHRLVPEIRERATEDHYALLEACASRNVERAREIQYDHVNLPLDALKHR